jgi:hypothetical protein
MDYELLLQQDWQYFRYWYNPESGFFPTALGEVFPSFNEFKKWRRLLLPRVVSSQAPRLSTHEREYLRDVILTANNRHPIGLAHFAPEHDFSIQLAKEIVVTEHQKAIWREIFVSSGFELQNGTAQYPYIVSSDDEASAKPSPLDTAPSAIANALPDPTAPPQQVSSYSIMDDSDEESTGTPVSFSDNSEDETVDRAPCHRWIPLYDYIRKYTSVSILHSWAKYDAADCAHELGYSGQLPIKYENKKHLVFDEKPLDHYPFYYLRRDNWASMAADWAVIHMDECYEHLNHYLAHRCC